MAFVEGAFGAHPAKAPQQISSALILLALRNLDEETLGLLLVAKSEDSQWDLHSPSGDVIETDWSPAECSWVKKNIHLNFSNCLPQSCCSWFAAPSSR